MSNQISGPLFLLSLVYVLTESFVYPFISMQFFYLYKIYSFLEVFTAFFSGTQF